MLSWFQIDLQSNCVLERAVIAPREDSYGAERVLGCEIYVDGQFVYKISEYPDGDYDIPINMVSINNVCFQVP